MADTKLVCQVCRNVFSEHQAIAHPVEPGEDQFACPRCGSTRIEPDHFDPNEPVENPLERHEQQEPNL